MFADVNDVRRQARARSFGSAPLSRSSLAALWRCVIGAAITICIAAHGASAQPVPTDEDRFTALAFRQFQKAMPQTEIHAVAPLTLSVGSGKEAHTLHLDNVYSGCVRNAATCDEDLAGFVARMTTLYTTPERPVDRAMLRAVIRPTAYVDQMRQVMARQGGPIVTELPGGLWLVGVFDLPTTIRMANRRDLEGLGLSTDEALSQAKQNMLAGIRQQIDDALKGERTEIKALAGDYVTGLFGFPDLLAPLAAAFNNNLLAAVPASNVLLCGDGTIPGMRADLGHAARTIMARAQRPFSDTVFRWSPTGWTALPPLAR